MYILFSSVVVQALAASDREARVHRKKRFTSFPSPAGMSLTKLPLGRNNSVMTSIFPPRESLVVTSLLGTGNFRTFFYGVCLVFGLLALSPDQAKNICPNGSQGALELRFASLVEGLHKNTKKVFLSRSSLCGSSPQADPNEF